MEKTQQMLKEEVALAAVQALDDNALIGVGTGSTVDCFIDALAASGKRVRAAVASSNRSAERLSRHGIAVVELGQLDEPLSVYVDGADEIEPGLAMIKGGGAALTREKLLPVHRLALSASSMSPSWSISWAPFHFPSR